MDMWTFTPEERKMFETQFQSLNPINGNITGENAKKFFMQSKLPPNILGFIWELSDVNCDGRLNINEFLVACKLIQLKLRGINIPTTLPPPLQAIINSGVTSMPRVPSGPSTPVSVSPVSGTMSSRSSLSSPPSVIHQPAAPVLPRPSLISPPLVHPTTGILDSALRQPVAGHGTVQMPTAQAPSSVLDDLLSLDPLLSSTPSQLPLSQGFPIPAPVTSVVSPYPQPPAPLTPPSPTVSSPLTIASQPQVGPPPATSPITIPIEPQKTGSPPSQEWAIPHQIKLKYTQMFNAADKSRTGFLLGNQARSIMVETKLAHPILAQIWNLADIDADGKLSCEEFVLAMYLCELAKSGHKIAIPLPPELIPPMFRRQRQNSIPAEGSGSGESSPVTQASFEDKRKENYEKGQAELDRRRKILLEIQRKEKEEQERKQREEQERKERIRLEQEKLRQEELERQLQKQREIEQEKEEQRKKLQEQREQARRELERQQQLEWENQRKTELLKKREEEKLAIARLDVEYKSLTAQLDDIISKVMNLSQKIGDTRSSVTSVKSTIDGMRTTRDSHMSEINQLKAKLKDQNQRLIAINQEKIRLEAKTKRNQSEENAIEQEKTNILITGKQATLKTLREKVTELEHVVQEERQKLENQKEELSNSESSIQSLVSECETMYATYLEKKNRVLEIKSKLLNETSWSESAWDSAPTVWHAEPSAETPSITITAYKKYRALYEFVARNPDELSFQPGDIIMVNVNQSSEPGWLAGELKGQAGWFPESYVECIEDLAPHEDAFGSDDRVVISTPLEEIAEVPEVGSDGSVVAEEGEWGPAVENENFTPFGTGAKVNFNVRALYEWRARNPSQLSFNKDDTMNVIEKQHDWYFGKHGTHSGWFPSSYTTEIPEVIPDFGAEQPEYYVAMYPYQSVEPDDLSFYQNDVIKVIKKEGEWWTGVLNDKVGVFPSNYVQKMELQPTVTSPTESKVPRCSSAPPTELNFQKVELERSMTPDFSTAQESKLKKPEIATAIAPYKATGPEQLSLRKGQLIIVRKKTSSGWWEGEAQAKGKRRQIGWFPASYVKCLNFNKGSSNIGDKSAPGQVSVPDAQQSVGFDRVVALYKYTAMNPDELSFEKDDIIKMIAKEEPDWWKGELNGVIGLFPSNYVSPL